MTEETKKQEKKPLPAITAGGAVKPIVPQDFEGAWRIASAVCKAGMAPRGLESPEKAMVSILHGLEVGFTPMAAMQSIAVVNGRASIWGDGALALVQASGKLEFHKEWLEGEGDKRKAFCHVKRRDDPEIKKGEFSVADAKRAGLWGKTGPWTQYPDRMLKMRARGFALRDGFSDVLRGLGIAEEVQDIPPRDITPAEEPPMPPDEPEAVADVVHEPEVEDAEVIEVIDGETGEVIEPADEVEEAEVLDIDKMSMPEYQQFLRGELEKFGNSLENLQELWTTYDVDNKAEAGSQDHTIIKALFAKRARAIGVVFNV